MVRSPCRDTPATPIPFFTVYPERESRIILNYHGYREVGGLSPLHPFTRESVCVTGSWLLFTQQRPVGRSFIFDILSRENPVQIEQVTK